MEIRISRKIATSDRKLVRSVWTTWKLFHVESKNTRTVDDLRSRTAKLVQAIEAIDDLANVENLPPRNWTEELNGKEGDKIMKSRASFRRQNSIRPHASSRAACMPEREQQRRLVWAARKQKTEEMKRMNKEDEMSLAYRAEHIRRWLVAHLRAARIFHATGLVRKGFSSWCVFIEMEEGRRNLRATILNERGMLLRAFHGFRRNRNSGQHPLVEERVLAWRTSRILKAWSLHMVKQRGDTEIKIQQFRLHWNLRGTLEKWSRFQPLQNLHAREAFEGRTKREIFQFWKSGLRKEAEMESHLEAIKSRLRAAVI